MAELSDLELLAELGVDAPCEPASTLTPLQERLIAGFEDIQRFVREHGRLPRHGEDRDIFERLYCRPSRKAARASRSSRASCKHRPRRILECDRLPGDRLYRTRRWCASAELGVDQGFDEDITRLRQSSSRSEKRAAEEIANREKCEDFEEFRPLLERVQADLTAGNRQAKPLGASEVTLAEIQPGNFFIVGGQLAYIAGSTEAFTTQYERADRRVRVIYDNATEATVLSRSFQKALYRDESARRVSELTAGPLFGNAAEPDDLESGTIYVLRSRSAHPYVDEHRDLVHKIGVTGQAVSARIANARNDPTFLLADVEVVAEYRLYNINRTKLERLIHRALGPARLDLSAGDRFGKAVQPREWFLVPLPAIDELVSRIGDGSITNHKYDPAQGAFVPVEDG